MTMNFKLTLVMKLCHLLKNKCYDVIFKNKCYYVILINVVTSFFKNKCCDVILL